VRHISVAEPLEITGTWREEVPLIEVNYAANQMFLSKTSQLLAEKLVGEYKTLTDQRETPRACILWIKAKTAGSPLVRAIFELYKVLHAEEATLYCAEYPENYMESLTSLGLPALPGFKLTETVEKALSLSKTVKA
jgi:hypothetical protein